MNIQHSFTMKWFTPVQDAIDKEKLERVESLSQGYIWVICNSCDNRTVVRNWTGTRCDTCGCPENDLPENLEEIRSNVNFWKVWGTFTVTPTTYSIQQKASDIIVR